MIKIDMWKNDDFRMAEKIDVFFYPSDAQYRGNIYISDVAVGDYVCNDSVELENTFSQLVFNW